MQAATLSLTSAPQRAGGVPIVHQAVQGGNVPIQSLTSGQLLTQRSRQTVRGTPAAPRFSGPIRSHRSGHPGITLIPMRKPQTQQQVQAKQLAQIKQQQPKQIIRLVKSTPPAPTEVKKSSVQVIDQQSLAISNLSKQIQQLQQLQEASLEKANQENIIIQQSRALSELTSQVQQLQREQKTAAAETANQTQEDTDTRPSAIIPPGIVNQNKPKFSNVISLTPIVKRSSVDLSENNTTRI